MVKHTFYSSGVHIYDIRREKLVGDRHKYRYSFRAKFKVFKEDKVYILKGSALADNLSEMEALFDISFERLTQKLFKGEIFQREEAFTSKDLETIILKNLYDLKERKTREIKEMQPQKDNRQEIFCKATMSMTTSQIKERINFPISQKECLETLRDLEGKGFILRDRLSSHRHQTYNWEISEEGMTFYNDKSFI